jgi:hypothetical protein
VRALHGAIYVKRYVLKVSTVGEVVLELVTSSDHRGALNIFYKPNQICESLIGTNTIATLILGRSEYEIS